MLKRLRQVANDLEEIPLLRHFPPDPSRISTWDIVSDLQSCLCRRSRDRWPLPLVVLLVCLTAFHCPRVRHPRIQMRLLQYESYSSIFNYLFTMDYTPIARLGQNWPVSSVAAQLFANRFQRNSHLLFAWCVASPKHKSISGECRKRRRGRRNSR
jgi:hypothetical protein